MKTATGKTAVLLISPETGRLPEEMGPLSRYISGKSGGLGEVVATLCEGLTRYGIECHLATLNLKKRFQKECRLDEDSWYQIRHATESNRIHLVSSSNIFHLSSAYAGAPLQTAAEFQRQLVNYMIKDIRANNRGNLIIHSHDWMAGGVVTAYARYRKIPVLHTIHNVHTGDLPMNMLSGVEIERLVPYLFFAKEDGTHCIDCQATAIKNADLISFVGERFLKEMLEDHFSDQGIVADSVRNEIKEKYRHGAVHIIFNAPSPRVYPEHCEHLIRKYGPEDNVMASKRESLVEFQRRTGLNVNPDAILLYWPSRLDPTQKGIEILEDIAHRFVIVHGDAQIAIVGDGVGRDKTHEEICGRIAWSSGGKITYQHFDEALSMLGFAAASDVFGASRYEPCGQIDQVGNLYGATATNRDTGGYHDKIRELILNIDGASVDSGNGFLFRDYDAGGLWYGLRRAVEFHRRPAEVRERQIKRIMRETRQRYDPNRMVDLYINAYERLNGGVPLI
ncbi:MAG: glycogen/starch synthase [Pseudomonadota bacterium]